MTAANQTETREYSSFRDPSGSVFVKGGVVFRRVNAVYIPHYNALMSSGLYQKLTAMRLLVPHILVEENNADGSIVLQPEQIPFVSYPYEWCFEQYKDAALAMLEIERQALHYGMTLKDASAYNIQFTGANAILIDTLSFETYMEGAWAGYGQFCRHFLCPLFLMSYSDERLSKLTQNYIDGIPLDLASLLLRGKGGFAVWQHIHLHAKTAAKYADAGAPATVQQNDAKSKYIKPAALKKQTLLAIIESLIRVLENLNQKVNTTEWGAYYTATNYSDGATAEKERIVKELVYSALGDVIAASKGAPPLVWDLGANDGRYSRLAAEAGAYTVAFDIDNGAVGHCYRALKQNGSVGSGRLLPLLLDLNAPSPAIGFANRERKTIAERGKPCLTLALALIHHLVISNNVPFAHIAEWLASFTKRLIIEFVPKTDSQVERLLRTRTDIFGGYNEAEFESAFGAYFSLLEKRPIAESKRTLYLFGALP
jgi:hypothetical protein